jgi:hypothetical protein
MQQDTVIKDKMRSVFEGKFSAYEIDSVSTLEKGEVILSIDGDRNIIFKVNVSNDDLALFAGGA